MSRHLLPSTNIGLRSDWNNYWNPTTTNVSLYDIRANHVYPSSTTNLSLYLYHGYYLFWITLSAPSIAGTVEVTYPYTVAASSVAYMSKQIPHIIYSYITIKAVAIYPYTFVGWYTASSGGTLISSSATYNFSYNHSAMANAIAYAQFV